MELHEKHAHAYLVIAVFAIRSVNTCVLLHGTKFDFYDTMTYYFCLILSQQNA